MDITQLDNDVIAHIMVSFKMDAVKTCYNFALTCTKFYSCLQKNKEKIDEHFIRYTKTHIITRSWYGNQMHSINGQPASIWSDGNKYWYYHGELHREDNLPAIEFDGGRKEWQDMVYNTILNNNFFVAKNEFDFIR